MSTVGGRIKYYRIFNGLKQKDIYEKIDIDKSTYIRYESKSTLNFDIEICKKMCEAIGIDPALVYDEYKKINNGNVDKILNDEKVLAEFAAMEHRRWCSFMFVNGYKYDYRKKDDLAKTNPCLISWNQLRIKKPEMLVYDVLGILICAERMKDNRIKFLY